MFFETELSKNAGRIPIIAGDHSLFAGDGRTEIVQMALDEVAQKKVHCISFAAKLH